MMLSVLLCVIWPDCQYEWDTVSFMASNIYFLLMGAPGGTQTKTQWTSDGFVCFISFHACIHSHTCMPTECILSLTTHTYTVYYITIWKVQKIRKLQINVMTEAINENKLSPIGFILKYSQSEKLCLENDSTAWFWHFPKLWQLLHLFSSANIVERQ